MDKDTLKTKEWLDKRFAEGVKDGEYFAHQPIYGYKKGRTEGRDLIRYMRNLSILVKLSHYNFDSFIDIGGAEGYMPNLVKTAFKADSYTCDLSFEANVRARELFGIDSVGMDLSNLPFKDKAFDAVLCSEVLEHVTNPIQAICELKRITKKVLVITTEAVCYDKLERSLRMMLVDLNEHHCDRNWFLPDDFVFTLGNDIIYENTIYDPRAADKKASPDEARKILSSYAERGTFDRDGIGITVLSSGIQKTERPRISVQDLADIILNTTVSTDYKNNAASRLPLSTKLIESLQCPKCAGNVSMANDTLTCSACGSKYAVRNNVPLMYTDDKDADYLSRKWAMRLSGEFASTYKALLNLIKLFEHSTSSPNIFTKIAARRIMKIEKFAHNCAKVIRQRSFLGLLSYFLMTSKKKVSREIDRIIGRFKKIKSD